MQCTSVVTFSIHKIVLTKGIEYETTVRILPSRYGYGGKCAGGISISVKSSKPPESLYEFKVDKSNKWVLDRRASDSRWQKHLFGSAGRRTLQTVDRVGFLSVELYGSLLTPFFSTSVTSCHHGAPPMTCHTLPITPLPLMLFVLSFLFKRSSRWTCMHD